MKRLIDANEILRDTARYEEAVDVLKAVRSAVVYAPPPYPISGFKLDMDMWPVCECCKDILPPLLKGYCFACGRPLNDEALEALKRIIGGNNEPAPEIVPPPNEPLTLEELRGMNGEPVWLRGSGLNRWYIFDGFSLDGIPFFTPEIGYGKPWAAYRRRPEEGTT